MGSSGTNTLNLATKLSQHIRGEMGGVCNGPGFTLYNGRVFEAAALQWKKVVTLRTPSFTDDVLENAKMWEDVAFTLASIVKSVSGCGVFI